MRAVVQRVKTAKVMVGDGIVGEIGKGLLIFLGVGVQDSSDDAEFLASKIAHLRIFSDSNEKMNLSLLEIGGEALVVSQFTLWGDCRKGRRPSFVRAADPAVANDLYQEFISLLKGKGIQVAAGRFQEMMDVYLVNDGPVTLLLDSARNF
ncbi:MAG: D-tyrosyl-tRNA(Tyr) deacylase [Deltaproteobacteria bacterium]|nr:MAG: D-tyrosyl-tRNA(Tyr) deacylase [Deltaproteobacteria bacterium]